MIHRDAVRSFLLRTAAGLAVFGAVGLSTGLSGGMAAPDPLAEFGSIAEAPSADALTWKLDPVHCMALFRIHHVGAGQFWGMFDGVTGTMSWPENGDEAPAFDVSVDVESVHTGTDKLDRTIMSPQFFNAKEFDTVAFKSSGGEKTGEGTWDVTGDFTMHGVTRPITARVELTGVAGNPVQKKAGFEATFVLKRSDFDMNWGVKNKALGDEVRMIVGLEGDWVK
ncbi:MAG: YceI family protein [Planctomycetota bacterium]|nr:YceI family protein [Planctomycetota bacterium]